MASVEVSDLRLAFSLLDKPALRVLKADVDKKIKEASTTLQEIRNKAEQGKYPGDAESDEEEALDWVRALTGLKKILDATK